MKYFVALVLTIAAYAVFDIGYLTSNHLLSLVIKGVAGSMFMFAGTIISKED